MTRRNERLANAKSLHAQEKPRLVCDVFKWATCKCQELNGAGRSMPGSTRFNLDSSVGGALSLSLGLFFDCDSSSWRSIHRFFLNLKKNFELMWDFVSWIQCQVSWAGCDFLKKRKRQKKEKPKFFILNSVLEGLSHEDFLLWLEVGRYFFRLFVDSWKKLAVSVGFFCLGFSVSWVDLSWVIFGKTIKCSASNRRRTTGRFSQRWS